MSFVMKVTSAIVIFASATGLALANGDDHEHYKGEMNYKGESVVAPCPQPCVLKDGFYVGAQVGYDAYRIRRDAEIGDLDADATLSATGWVGGLFLGYGQYLSDYFYLGAEVFGNYSNAKGDYSVVDDGVTLVDNDVRVRGSWGVSLLPGIRINDCTLGYVRLGWNWTRVKAEDDVIFLGEEEGKKTVNGFNWGLGLETLLMDCWSLRAEYTHTNYKTYERDIIEGVSEVEYKPSDNQFMVGVVYHFA